jgi:AcrR family transcriptional regulator
MSFPAFSSEQIQTQAAESASRKRTKQGEQTRQLILRAAVTMASREGLESLTIGKLATELSMSKSGLFAHFKSKEDLQLSTFNEACAIFNEEVLQPAYKAEKGVKRLWELCQVWLEYGDRSMFFGGEFFTNVAAEYDGRSGPVRDVVAKTMRDWLRFMERLLRDSIETGELKADTNAQQVAFEFNALFYGASLAFQLNMEPGTSGRMKIAVRDKLLSIATDQAKLKQIFDGG